MIELLPVQDPAWADFVTAHPDATCFHGAAWLSTIAGAYGFSSFVAVQRDDDGRLIAGLPLVEVRRPGGARRWVSLPFSDECGPLVAPGGSATGLLLGVHALSRSRHVADLQVRAPLDVPGARSQQVAVTHTLPLGAVDGNPPIRPRSSVRRHVAAARRLGVQVERAEKESELVGTYYGLHVQTRRRQGVPAQPRRYFRLLWEQVLAPGHGCVLIARHHGVPVAGAVYLVGGRTVTYKYGASDAGAWSLRPNHAVMASAIDWAANQGYAFFDFGRTDLDNPGLIQFKDSWGAQSRALMYTSFSGRGGYRSGSPARALTAQVIRRCPEALCRGLGELLYRFAA